MPLNRDFNSIYLRFFPFLFLLSVVLLFSFSEWSLVEATRFQFKPKDWEPMLKNQTKKWKQKLTRHAINRAKKVAKLDKLPNPPEVKVKRVIKKANSKSYDPCKVVDGLCLNGGKCLSVDEEWSCECQKTHYGKSCEFLADQTECGNNWCENNSTCYSVEKPRTVPNIKLHAKEVERCSKDELQSGTNDCSFTLTVNYRCWCRPGFEGDFCEFSEGERCCAEDHCNHHGLITDLFNVSKMESCDANQHCNCTCEANYMGDNCEKVSPCRDRECLNGGRCEYNSTSDEARCVCPSGSQFFIDAVRISGSFCEIIEFDDSEACYPCGDGKSFKSYLDCLRSKGFRNIGNKFVKQCGKKRCEQKIGNKFCMNDGQCQVTVANFSDLSPDSPLFLIPKCQCDSERFEGDFCEHHQLDECDKKDLSLNGKAGENTTEEQRVRIVGTEAFLRELKNIAFHQIPLGSSDRSVVSKAFERVLHAKGMVTFCGPNGLCRPYNEEGGFGCKCDGGFEGTRCEMRDPCWGEQKCPEHSLCVDIPALDEDASQDAQNILKHTCICRTSQDINVTTHMCMAEHGGLYEKCFDDNKQPKCQNDGHCYPCEFDDQVVTTAGVKQSRLPLCDQMEKRRGFRCVCLPGFASSSNCRNESHPCDFHQCQNSAKCIPMPEPDDALNYECKCQPGYAGSLCHRVENICLTDSVCGNGTCRKDTTLKRGFRCDCFQGYFGFNCEHMGDTGWTAFVNDNYRWTYPLLVFSLLTPAVLVAIILQDRRITEKYGSPENAPSYYQVLSNYVD